MCLLIFAVYTYYSFLRCFLINLQLKSDQTERLLNKPYVDGMNLREQNLPLKCCQPLKMLILFEEGFRSFHTIGIGSVGQRAAKLPAFKFGGLEKNSAARPQPLSNQLAKVRLHLVPNHSQSLKDGNFAAL